MVKLPYEVPFGDYTVQITAAHHCFRWDVLDCRDLVSLYHGHCESVAIAVSEAFDWIDGNTDYLEAA